VSYSDVVTASLHKLTAGDGYTYLTRQVAVTDSTERGRSTLADYYSEKGERPGHWVGRGVAGLGSIAVGDRVTEAQMRALFGEGRHPNADVLQKLAIASGARAQDALKVSLLGRAYPVMKGEPTAFLVETQRRYQAYNAARGRRLNAPVPDEVRSQIRTEVGRSTFEAAHGRQPADEQELTSHVTRQSRRPPQAVAGFDVTFTPVKSISSLWAVAPRQVAEEIEAAHEVAVQHAIGWLEQEVAHTRRGAKGVRQTEVEGIVATAFQHRDSRAGDPNLHTHVAIANKVQDRSDGAWLSLDGAALYRAMVSVSEHYNSHIEAELVRRLGVEFVGFQPQIDRRPIRELVGVPTDLLDAWSSRRAQIEAETGRLARQFVDDHGRAPTAREMIKLAQEANLATREDKHEPRSLAEQRAAWRDQAVAVLGSPEAVDAIARNACHRVVDQPDAGVRGIDEATLDQVAVAVVDAVSRARARWQPTHVMAEAYRQLRPLDLPVDAIDPSVAKVTERVLTGAVPLSRDDPIEVPTELRRSDGTSVYEPKHTRLYTTTAVLDAEQRIVEAALRRDGRTVDGNALALAMLEAEANGLALNAGQADLVRELGTSGQRVQLAIAPAGSGKTTAMQVLARAWADSGGTVIGLAPSAVAADELRAAVPGGTVDTLAQLTYALAPPTGEPPIPVPAWAERINQGTLVVVDEAGMAGTTDLAAVVDFVLASGGSVRLIGDTRQLAAIGAGGVLRDVQEAAGAATLAELMRFSDPAEAAATLAVRDGDPTSVGFYLDHGRIHDAGDPEEEIVAAWASDVAEGKTAVMIASTRETTGKLNELARQRRIQLGLVDAASAAATLRSGLPATVGDQVLTRHNDRRNRLSKTDFVKNGDRWTVVEVGLHGALRVQHQRSNRITWLSADYVARHVDHAYAVTVHAAQGSTVDVSHVLLDGTEDRQTAYVALSRGRDANHVYLRSAGDGDPHNVIKPEVVRPSTGAEILASILERDGAEQSASTSARLVASPQELLRQHALRYLDGVYAAAENLAGPEALRRIDQEAESVLPGVTACGGWPLLRMMLATIQVSGQDPMEELQKARDSRPLDDAQDLAAVLAWRLDDTDVFGGQGPLPWLRATPAVLQQHASWGPYLQARAELVTHFAGEVHDQATLTVEPPRWAQTISHDHHLWRTVAVWRAAIGIPDTDLIPTGARLAPSRERNYQEVLEGRVAAAAGPAVSLPSGVGRLLDEREPEVIEDPFWPVLARRIVAAEARGTDVEQLLATALDQGRLPEERPAAALWFRLAGKLRLTSADIDPDIRLRPVWTDDLLRRLPPRVGQRLLTSPDWPELIAVVTDRATDTGLAASELLDHAIGTLNLQDPAAGGIPADAAAALLADRIHTLTSEPPHDPEDLPPDPLDLEHEPPADVDQSHPDAEPETTPGVLVDEPVDQAEPEPEPEVPAEEATGSTPRARLVELNNAAAAWWAERYRGSSAAAYIAGRLGGNDLAHNQRVTVGYAPAGWTNLVDHLRAGGATDTELVDAGLAKWSRRGTLIDLMRDRVVFGIRDNTGDLVGFTGRAAPGDTNAPKWLNTPATDIFCKGQLLYGYAENRDLLAAGATPVRVEGVLDALAINLASNNNAVGLAPLGTALTAAQADTLVRGATNKLILHATDDDSAGITAAAKDYWLLTSRGANVRRLVMTDGQQTFHDPADAYSARRDSLGYALRATNVAPALAGRLAADVIARNRDLLEDRHAHVIVGVGREIGSILAASPIEEREELVTGAAAMLAAASHGDDDLTHYLDLISDATRSAAQSWTLPGTTRFQAAISTSSPSDAVAAIQRAQERLRHTSVSVARAREEDHREAPARGAQATTDGAPGSRSDALKTLSALRGRQQEPRRQTSDHDRAQEDRNRVAAREPDRGGLER